MSILDLIHNYRIFRKYPSSRQFVKFSFVGSFVTTVDFTIYFSLTRLFTWWGEHFLYANALAFITALSISFFANKLWTFKNDHKSYTKKYIKFFISNLIALSGTQGILYILVALLEITDVIAKPAAVGAVLLWNFTIYKFWVFPQKKT